MIKAVRSISVGCAILLFAAASHAQQQIVLSRGDSTISLEPYAPNIIRVTLSLQKDQAVAGRDTVLWPRPQHRMGSTRRMNGDTYRSAAWW